MRGDFMKSDTVVVALIVAVVLVTGGAVIYMDSTVQQTGSYGVLVPQYVRSAADEGSGYRITAPVVDCFDTDGGKNYVEKGTVYIGNNVYTDVCDSQTGMLIENWCDFEDSGKPRRGWAYIECPNLCRDGACLI
jgi:hypothetical protein